MKLWPTWKQFKQWSLPSKYTFLGFILGALTSGMSIYFTVSPNPKLVRLEQALRAEKPTKLEIQSVESGHHVGVKRKLVYVTLKNKSNRPAYSVSAHLIANTSNSLPTPSTDTLRQYLENEIMIRNKESLKLPIAYLKDVKSALNVPCISSFTTKPNGLRGNFTKVGLGVEFAFETVFESTKQELTSLWAVVPASCS